MNTLKRILILIAFVVCALHGNDLLQKLEEQEKESQKNASILASFYGSEISSGEIATLESLTKVYDEQMSLKLLNLWRRPETHRLIEDKYFKLYEKYQQIVFDRETLTISYPWGHVKPLIEPYIVARKDTGEDATKAELLAMLYGRNFQELEQLIQFDRDKPEMYFPLMLIGGAAASYSKNEFFLECRREAYRIDPVKTVCTILWFEEGPLKASDTLVGMLEDDPAVLARLPQSAQCGIMFSLIGHYARLNDYDTDKTLKALEEIKLYNELAKLLRLGVCTYTVVGNTISSSMTWRKEEAGAQFTLRIIDDRQNILQKLAEAEQKFLKKRSPLFQCYYGTMSNEDAAIMASLQEIDRECWTESPRKRVSDKLTELLPQPGYRREIADKYFALFEKFSRMVFDRKILELDHEWSYLHLIVKSYKVYAEDNKDIPPEARLLLMVYSKECQKMEQVIKGISNTPDMDYRLLLAGALASRQVPDPFFLECLKKAYNIDPVKTACTLVYFRSFDSRKAEDPDPLHELLENDPATLMKLPEMCQANLIFDLLHEHGKLNDYNPEKTLESLKKVKLYNELAVLLKEYHFNITVFKFGYSSSAIKHKEQPTDEVTFTITDNRNKTE